MGKKSRPLRRYQQNLAAVQDEFRSVVTELDHQFGHVQHDLWDGDIYYVSPYREEFAKEIRGKHLDDLTNRELDYLMFTVITTMGSVPTLKFLLPRFFAAHFSNGIGGATADPHVLQGKLESANVEQWSEAERRAALMALIAYDRYEKRFYDSDFDVDDGEVSAADWARALLEGND